MKIPKGMNKFCKTCKVYTEQKVTQAKRKGLNATHHLSRGSRHRLKKRGLLGMGNTGSYSRPPMNKRKMAGKKQSKKVDLRYACVVCKKINITTHGIRAKKVEFI